MKSVNYHVPALEKGLDILEALSAAQSPQSLSDLSRTLDRSSSELFRMVDCLDKRGYIVKDNYSGNYMLSLKLFELAHTHSPVEQLLGAADKPLRDLTFEIRESCHISIIRQGKLIVLKQAESPEKVRLSVEVGAEFSAIHTVSGRLLLAHLPTEELDVLLADDEEFKELSGVEQQEYHDRLGQIRSKGYEVSENESHMGIKDMSVLVGNVRTGPVAALAVSYLTSAKNRENKKEFLSALQSCVRNINKALGMDV